MDPSGGLGFRFELTQPGSPAYSNAAASGNDVLRLTGGTPFASALGSGNAITLDFTGTSPLVGQTYRGGFYADNGGDFLGTIRNASFNYLGLGSGESVLLSTIPDSANFGSGNVSGYVTQFTIAVPEPGQALLMILGGAALAMQRRRC